VQPRRAVSVRDVPPEDWITIPVPALVEPAVFAAVQDQLQENKRHARPSRRGALYLLQGVLQCQHCGYAFYGKRLSPSARTGKPRADAYYRCLGTDAYRFGGERICHPAIPASPLTFLYGLCRKALSVPFDDPLSVLDATGVANIEAIRGCKSFLVPV